MSNKIPADRMQLAELAPKGYAAMFRLSGSIELDHEIRELIDIRASQINGCAFCLDMHWKDARAAGQSEERLYMLSTWRESSLYSERERAALELCEAMTRLADDGVPDDVWERARAAFEEYELGQLVFAITTINA
jgi:AhpD family alkylhydroperoxidase